MPVYKMGELFCGPGGIALGARSALVKNKEGVNYKITHCWANDYDKDTCNTYIENICPKKPESVIHCDVRKLEFDKLEKIDILSFGFPCNDFSLVGEQLGFKGSFGGLYHFGVMALQHFQPLCFFAENVGGIRSANDGAAFKQILKELSEIGYRIYPHLYKFEDYGLPQARHRVVIIGFRKDTPYEFSPPSPKPFANKDNSCKTALEIPPISHTAFNNEITKQSPQVIERLQHIKPGQNAFNADLPEHLKLNVKGARMSQIYKRLDPTKPAYTITGSGGGGTHVYHYKEPRALTNRERARLQTFPDSYKFLGSKESVRKQIGMAVPPEGARIIFESVLKTIAGISYKSIPCNLKESFCND